MKRILAMLTVLALLTGFSAVCAESASSAMPRTTKLTARFATVEEGKERMRERTAYHNQINETMLPFILQKKGGSLDEYIEYSAEQVLEFTPEDELRVNETLTWLRDHLEKHGLKLPDPGAVTFVKSTGETTDIVQKEMYAFEDAGHRQLAIRPEGTPARLA